MALDPKPVPISVAPNAGIHPIVVDAPTRRGFVREKTIKGLEGLFPLIGRTHELHVENVQVKPASYSSNDQKTAILHGRTLAEPVVGTLVLKEKATGKVVDTKKNHILAHMPYFTERHTFIVGGNEYELPNQLRLKSGVYTRERGNGEYEAAFNLSKGENFRLSMDPATGKMSAEFGTTTLPLAPMLKHLGVQDSQLKQAWGADLYQANAAIRKTTEETVLNKLVARVKRPKEAAPTTIEGKRDFLHKYFENTQMDPSVTARTLGKAYDKVTPQAILDASKKLLDVHRGEATEDDRDSLEFKHIRSSDDFFQERLEKDAKRSLAPKLVWKMDKAKTGKIKDFVPNSAFTRSLNSFLTSSAIAAVPTQYNPMEIIDHASKITSLGEGGIESDRAIPFEARKVHNTHIGILDPVRTPESGHAGIDIRAAMGGHRDANGNLYGRFINAKTGKPEVVPVTTLAKSVIGHAGEYGSKSKIVDALHGSDNVRVERSKVDYFVENPTHMFSPSTALVPFLDGIQGNRAIMGSKFQVQALPLLERDVPFVMTAAPRGTAMTQEMARMTVPTAHVHGTVAKVDKDFIYIRPDATKKASEGGVEDEELEVKLADYSMDDLEDEPEMQVPEHLCKTAALAGAQTYMQHIHDSLAKTAPDLLVAHHVTEGQDAQGYPATFIETHLMTPTYQTLHEWATHHGYRPASYIHESLPRGFTTVLKTRDGVTVPKVDWTFLNPKARGRGLGSAYFSGIEAAAQAAGHPEIHVDASDDGLEYWARPQFGMISAEPAARAAARKAGDSILYRKPVASSTKTAAAKKSDEGLLKLPYDSHFPLAAKTYLHNTVTVKPGDKVAPGQQLATSNFTKDGHIALGKNMSVAYLAYYGKNSNDAVVISEGASQKLTSEHMYKETLRKGPDTIMGKDKYKAYYGMRFTAAQLDKLDDNGVAKPGKTFEPGDPLILALDKATPSPDAALLGALHKSLVKPYRDAAVVWEHHTPGTVVDAVNAARQAVVTVRTEERMKVGDKLANRFGGKGVVSEIIPDHKMVQDEKGKPIDVLFTSAGIVSRINPAQVVEAALGKVVEKTGKPIVLPQFADGNNVDFAKKLLAKHKIKDKETVLDPVSGRQIPGVFVGRSYIHKLFKSTETNYAARGVSTYDVNLQPTKGGEEGAKGLGKMEINTFLAHNARNTLKDALTIKSEKSDDYWRAMEFGLPPPPPKSPFVTEKLTSMLKGAGINVDKRGTTIGLHALTDDHVKKMSSGALTLPTLEKSTSFMVTAKDLKPEKGGLFDPVLTGGMSGNKWAHIELPEPTLNPIFEDPARRLLGYTKQELRQHIADHGGDGLRKSLNAIDLDKKERELMARTNTARGADLDDAVKQLKYIRALKQNGHAKAGDAYTLSKVPVIPPVMRPILPSQKSGELQISDANYLYRDLALAASSLHSTKQVGLPSLTAGARLHMYDAQAALAGVSDPVSPQLQGRGVKGFVATITGQGSPKSGFLFKKVLKRQQDMSGRATATPDNTLDMDQVGVPEDMLWVTYEKFLMKGLIGQGYNAVKAKEMIEQRHPAARAVLDRELGHRPVFINRAPSLHKHNMVAAFAVPVQGKSLRINPFMEKGMNLDYDGDTMQLHVPVSHGAVKEAQGLTLSKLLFSDKHRDDLMIFPQHEAIIGTYLATAKGPSGALKKFKTKADAIAAYKRGEITLQTPVEIGP